FQSLYPWRSLRLSMDCPDWFAMVRVYFKLMYDKPCRVGEEGVGANKGRWSCRTERRIVSSKAGKGGGGFETWRQSDLQGGAWPDRDCQDTRTPGGVLPQKDSKGLF